MLGLKLGLGLGSTIMAITTFISRLYQTATSTRSGTRTVLGFQSADVLFGVELYTDFDTLDPTFTDNLDGTFSVNNTSGGNDWIAQINTLTVSSVYETTLEIISISAGTLQVNIGAGSNPETTPGVYTYQDTATTTALQVLATAGTVARFELLTAKEVTQPSLITVPTLTPAFNGYRQLADNSWSPVDAEGVTLPDPKGMNVVVSGEQGATDDDRNFTPKPSIVNATQFNASFTFTPTDTAAVGAVIASYTDANNFIKCHLNGTQAVFEGTLASTPFGPAVYAFATTAATACEFIVGYDGADLSVGARDVGDAYPTLATAAFTGDLPLEALIALCNDGNAGSILKISSGQDLEWGATLGDLPT